MQLTLSGLGHWPKLPFSLLPLFPYERIVKTEIQNQTCRGAKPSVVPILGCLRGPGAWRLVNRPVHHTQRINAFTYMHRCFQYMCALRIHKIQSYF